MKKKYKNQIIQVIKDLNDQSISADQKRDKEEDNDSFFYQTGKITGLKMAIMKLNKLIK